VQTLFPAIMKNFRRKCR